MSTSTDELVVLLEGGIEVCFAGKNLCPQIGEEIFIPAGEKHTVKNIGTTTNRWGYGYETSKKET